MSIQKRSFITGLLYISLAVIGPIGFMILPNMFGGADNLVTFATSNVALIWLWFFVELLIISIEIVLTVYLWKLLNEHNKTISFIAFVFRMIMIVVMVINSIFLLAVAFKNGANADVFIPMHDQWVFIWQLSFSFHVLLIGYMVLRYLTSLWRYLGVAMILGAVGYFIASLNHLILWDVPFLTTAATILLFAVTIGEIGMAVALLLKKVVPSNG